ncbi:MAG: PTS fructose transporter subunit IIC, partial [Tenericutes bacterium HGW-Tenericutes-6]
MKRRVNIYKNMMSGISQLLPFIVAGGVFISLSFLFNSYQSNSEIALWFNDTGKLIISFSLPVLAAFIAYAIADRPGLVPGFIAGALALAGGSGFLGALIGGFASGYIALIIIKIFSRLPRSVHGFNAILFFPVLGALFAALFMIGVNLVIEPATTTLITFINGLNVVGVIITGLVAASLMAFDLGGPVNKVTYMLGIATIINGDQSILMAAIMAG